MSGDDGIKSKRYVQWPNLKVFILITFQQLVICFGQSLFSKCTLAHIRDSKIDLFYWSMCFVNEEKFENSLDVFFLFLPHTCHAPIGIRLEYEGSAPAQPVTFHASCSTCFSDDEYLLRCFVLPLAKQPRAHAHSWFANCRVQQML